MNRLPPNLGCGCFSSCSTDTWYPKHWNPKKSFFVDVHRFCTLYHDAAPQSKNAVCAHFAFFNILSLWSIWNILCFLFCQTKMLYLNVFLNKQRVLMFIDHNPYQNIFQITSKFLAYSWWYRAVDAFGFTLWNCFFFFLFVCFVLFCFVF